MHFPSKLRLASFPCLPAALYGQGLRTDRPIRRHRVASILIIAAGTVFYTWVKSIEAASAPPRPPVVPKDDVEAGAGAPLNRIDEEVFDMQEKKGAHPA